MFLENLMRWAVEMNRKEKLVDLVRKNPDGKPRSSDIIVCTSFLRSLQQRIQDYADSIAKQKKIMANIVEQLQELEKRGVVVPTKVIEEMNFPEGKIKVPK